MKDYIKPEINEKVVNLVCYMVSFSSNTEKVLQNTKQFTFSDETETTSSSKATPFSSSIWETTFDED